MTYKAFMPFGSSPIRGLIQPFSGVLVWWESVTGKRPVDKGENRFVAKEEAYQQVGQSASLFKAILEYVARSSKAEK
jgi:hypothetical protein